MLYSRLDGTEQVRRRRRGPALVAAGSLVASLVVAVVGAAPAATAPGDISTAIGEGLIGPWGLDETAGSVLVSDELEDLVKHVDSSGTMSDLAGGGVIPLGDGGPATAASMNLPEGVWVAAGGNLLVADENNHRVRRVDAATGIITTIAGNGTAGSDGDGGPATAAAINQPLRAITDANGNLFITELGSHRVRRVVPGADGVVDGDADEIITTVMGTGVFGSDGDGGPASAATVAARGLALDTANNLYVADVGGPTVRKVTAGGDGVVDGSDIVDVYAGGGFLPMGGDGENAPATDVFLGFPEGLAFSAGNLYMSVVGEPRVLLVDTTQHVRTVAGTGQFGASGQPNGDGGPATQATFSFVFGITVDSAGNLYTADVSHFAVRKIVPGADGTVDGDPDEIITRVAGNGFSQTSGDGGPSVEAQINRPSDVASTGATVYIAEANANRVRRIDQAGIITTVAGGGIGDGLQGTDAILDRPRGVVDDGAGGALVADCGHQRIRHIDSAGQISTFAGGLVPFRCPSGLHLVTSGPAAGTLYVADSASHRVLKRDPGGTVTSVAGTGAPGYSGDGGPANAAQLNAPTGVSVDSAGIVYVADTANNRVRAISPGGTITTVAGNGDILWGTDGVAATKVPVSAPTDMARDAAGNLVVLEGGFHRVRRVSPAGVITTVAGNGIPSFLGDGGPADIAQLAGPTQLDIDGGGNLLFTEHLNGVVRRIDAGTPAPRPTSGCGQLVTKNLTLKADIGPCEGDGLVIGADGITVNLNGFRVFGTEALDDTVGIRLTGRKGVIIKGGATPKQPGGTVSDFGVGIALIGSSKVTVEDVQVVDNLGPPTVDEATFGDGIGLFFSSDNRIQRNVVDNNGIYDGIAVLGVGSSRNIIRRNTVSRTNTLDSAGFNATGIGIVLTPFLSENLPRETSLTENVMTENIVRDNDNSGISNISNVRGVITNNQVVDNGAHPAAFPANGIGVQTNERANPNTQVLVADNVITGNGHETSFGGLQGDGINIFSNENQVLRNQVHANKGSGIFVRADFGANRFGNRNVIHFNDASNNSGIDTGHADLFDSHFTIQFEPEFAFIEHCDENDWFGNIWGSGGFYPVDGPFAGCSATGGHEAAAAPATSDAAKAIKNAAIAKAKEVAQKGAATLPVPQRGGRRR